MKIFMDMRSKAGILKGKLDPELWSQGSLQSTPKSLFRHSEIKEPLKIKELHFC